MDLQSGTTIHERRIENCDIVSDRILTLGQRYCWETPEGDAQWNSECNHFYSDALPANRSKCYAPLRYNSNRYFWTARESGNAVNKVDIGKMFIVWEADILRKHYSWHVPLYENKLKPWLVTAIDENKVLYTVVER